MKRTTEKGFTLIELLAVIVILAIIALIAVPVIMNIINKANKSAFKDTAYGIISAGELYFAEQQLDPMGMSDDETITLPDTTKKLELKGEVPEGEILITKDGKIAIAVYNNRYCVTKGLEDKDITIIEDYESCELPRVINSNNILLSLATISSEVTSIPDCIKNNTTCTAGTQVAIKVNESEVYNFYVMYDEPDEMTLIMDRNLGDTVSWYETGENDKGPLTALAALKERTSGWTNIEEKEYLYVDNGGENKYASFTETMRARMFSLVDANKLECAYYDAEEKCPNWLYVNSTCVGNQNCGYWLSDARFSNSAYFMYGYGEGGTYEYIGPNPISTFNYSYIGVRPIITISK